VGLKINRPDKVKGGYALTLLLPRPDRRRRDIDNAIKPTNDLLVHAEIVQDDSMCIRVAAEWIENSSDNHMTVRIEPVS